MEQKGVAVAGGDVGTGVVDGMDGLDGLKVALARRKARVKLEMADVDWE